jgi:predicted nucleotidyltransferase
VEGGDVFPATKWKLPKFRQRGEDEERKTVDADEEQQKNLWRGVLGVERIVEKMFSKQRWGEVVEMLKLFKEENVSYLCVRDLLLKWLTWIFGLCKENPQVLKAVYELLDVILEATAEFPLTDSEQQILLPTLFDRLGSTRTDDLVNRHFLSTSSTLVSPAGILQHLTVVINTTKNRRTLVACFQVASALLIGESANLSVKLRRDLLRAGVVVHWQTERGIREFVTVIAKSIAMIDEPTFIAVIKDPAISHDLRNLWLVLLSRWRAESQSEEEQFGQMTPDCPTPRVDSSPARSHSATRSTPQQETPPSQAQASPPQPSPASPRQPPVTPAPPQLEDKTPLRRPAPTELEFMTANSRVSPMQSLKAVREARKRQMLLRPSASVLFSEEADESFSVRAKFAGCWHGGYVAAVAAVRCFGEYLRRRADAGGDAVVDVVVEAAEMSFMWGWVREGEEMEKVFRGLVRLLVKEQTGSDRVNLALVKIMNGGEVPVVVEGLLRLRASMEDEGGGERKIVDAAIGKMGKLVTEYLKGYQGERNLAMMLGVMERWKSAEMEKAVGKEKMEKMREKLQGRDENTISHLIDRN